MAINMNNNITWNDLITTARNNLIASIDNLEGNTIPQSLNGSTVVFSSRKRARTSYQSQKAWTTVSQSTVLADFDNFLATRNLNNRSNQIVSTRLILNFFENIAHYYTNRLVFVYSPFTNTRVIYYYNNGTSPNSWSYIPPDIPVPTPVEDTVTATDIQTMLTNINANLKNKVRLYEQKYNFVTTCSSSCSSSSSSSSSCWTIIHQNLNLLK